MTKFYIIFIPEEKITITTEMTYSTEKEPSETKSLKDELDIIIAAVLTVDSPDITLNIKSDLKQLDKNRFVILVTIETKNEDIFGNIKHAIFIKDVKDAIRESKKDAVKGVTLESISNTRCEGCGK